MFFLNNFELEVETFLGLNQWIWPNLMGQSMGGTNVPLALMLQRCHKTFPAPVVSSYCPCWPSTIPACPEVPMWSWRLVSAGDANSVAFLGRHGGRNWIRGGTERQVGLAASPLLEPNFHVGPHGPTWKSSHLYQQNRWHEKTHRMSCALTLGEGDLLLRCIWHLPCTSRMQQELFELHRIGLQSWTLFLSKLHAGQWGRASWACLPMLVYPLGG